VTKTKEEEEKPGKSLHKSITGKSEEKESENIIKDMVGKEREDGKFD